MKRWVWVVALVGLVAGQAAASGFVWWEAEQTGDTNFPNRTHFSPQRSEAHLLSGQNWLTNDGPRGRGEDEAYARYSVRVEQAGEYHLWVRKFWKHGPFRWRFNEREWATCGRNIALADSVTLRKHLVANWVSLGTVTLEEGAHRFEVRLLAEPGEAKTAGFDCFVLSRAPFNPRGKLKPGERTGLADEGFFAWEPGLDPLHAGAMLDLRHLNESVAGQSGYVTRDGDRLLLGDGSEARFWAVNVNNANASQDAHSVDYLADKLAKLGVNMVRYHTPVFASQPDGSRVNAKKLDRLHYLVAAMKKRGIYTSLSTYFPLWVRVEPQFGIAGYEGFDNKHPFGLIYFNERLQQMQRLWFDQMLNTPNPYTGVPLGRDPAVAMVELVNEDSCFFWTFNHASIPPVQWRKVEERFGAWLIARYGSIEAAQKRWGGARQDSDAPDEGRMAVLEAWHMTGDGVKAGGAAKRKRMSDQVRFLAALQRDYYAQGKRYLNETLGYKGLVTASNWNTADWRTLDAIERYTYTATDVSDQHGYIGGVHEGGGASYSVNAGDTIEHRSGLRDPNSLPIRVRQTAGMPHMISELGWTNPNRYRAEGPILSAVYGAQQGVDAVVLFIVHSNYVDDQQMEKFAWSSPVIANSSPAAALIYRRGDVSQAQPIVSETLDLDHLYNLHGSMGNAPSLDALRQKDIPESAKDKPSVDDYHKLTFFVGRVLRSFRAEPVASHVEPLDLTEFIDPVAKRVIGVNRETAFDYGRGVVTVNSERAKGAVGFLGEAGAVELGDVTIRCGNEYASVVLVSLDGEPLDRSKRVLVQTMTVDRPYGYREVNGKITSLGSAPFGVEKVRVGLRLNGPAWGDVSVTALDEHGYATERPVTLKRSGDATLIGLRPDAVYHVLTRP